MGLFDKFKKPAAPAKPTAITVEAVPTAVYAPTPGAGVAMADLPDPVFASGAMGKAYGIVPTEGVVYAPATGTITATTPTMHALSIHTDDGIDVLIHVGVDTVNMKGDGFTSFVEKDAHVVAGEPLMTFDIAKIKKAGYATDVITVITNTDEFKSVEPVESAEVAAGAKIFDVVPA